MTFWLEKEKKKRLSVTKKKEPETIIKKIYEEFLPIFYAFPPAEPWAMIGDLWETFIHDLRVYFTWEDVENITNTVLKNLKIWKDHEEEKPSRNAIHAELRRYFRRMQGDTFIVEPES